MACRLVQRLGNGLCASTPNCYALITAFTLGRRGLFSLISWNRRHVSLLMLGKVAAGPGQDTSHTLKQNSVGLLNLATSIYLPVIYITKMVKLTFNHLFFLSFHNWMVHAFWQGVVDCRPDCPQPRFVLLLVLLPHTMYNMPIYLGDCSVHLSLLLI